MDAILFPVGVILLSLGGITRWASRESAWQVLWLVLGGSFIFSAAASGLTVGFSPITGAEVGLYLLGHSTLLTGFHAYRRRPLTVWLLLLWGTLTIFTAVYFYVASLRWEASIMGLATLWGQFMVWIGAKRIFNNK